MKEPIRIKGNPQYARDPHWTLLGAVPYVNKAGETIALGTYTRLCPSGCGSVLSAIAPTRAEYWSSFGKAICKHCRAANRGTSSHPLGKYAAAIMDALPEDGSPVRRSTLLVRFKDSMGVYGTLRKKSAKGQGWKDGLRQLQSRGLVEFVGKDRVEIKRKAAQP